MRVKISGQSKEGTIGRNGSNKHLRSDLTLSRVYIAHSHRDEGQISMLRGQRKNTTLNFIDYSIKIPLDHKWKSEAKYKIKSSDCLLLAMGSETHNSKSVKWETKIAKRYHKPIIGLRLLKNAKVPQYAKNDGITGMKWDCENLGKKINKNRKK